MSAGRTAFPWWLYGLLVLAIGLAGFWPLFLSLVGSNVAASIGCPVSEAEPAPVCMVNGENWGPSLLGTVRMGYALILTLPVAALMFIGLVVAFFVHRAVIRGNG